MINLLAALLIMALVLYACYLFVNWLPLPEPAKQIAILLIAIIGLVWIFQKLGILAGGLG